MIKVIFVNLVLAENAGKKKMLRVDFIGSDTFTTLGAIYATVVGLERELRRESRRENLWTRR